MNPVRILICHICAVAFHQHHPQRLIAALDADFDHIRKAVGPQAAPGYPAAFGLAQQFDQRIGVHILADFPSLIVQRCDLIFRLLIQQRLFQGKQHRPQHGHHYNADQNAYLQRNRLPSFYDCDNCIV